MDSILTSIKKLLGVAEEYDQFDTDIIIHINSVMAVLTQLGVGPPTGFSIMDDSATWDDYIPENQALLNTVKSYMYLKVKLLFDPPTASSALTSIENIAKEFEWRISVIIDSINKEASQNG